VDGSEVGAAFSFQFAPENQTIKGQLETKYISLSKVNVDLSGTKERMLVVRDLTPLVN